MSAARYRPPQLDPDAPLAPALESLLREALDPARSAEPILAEFRRRQGRAPRVLCIGNVANNGYNNGKILTRSGWDCDVVCYDYYHIMGCPEWEDADFAGDVGDPFHPDWRRVDLHGFRRPSWFLQGPRSLCVQTLLARRTGRPVRAWFWNYVLKNWQRPHVQRATQWYQGAKRWVHRLRGGVPRGSPQWRSTPQRLSAALQRRLALWQAHNVQRRAWIRWRIATSWAIWKGRVLRVWRGVGRLFQRAHQRFVAEQWRRELPRWIVALALPVATALLVMYHVVDWGAGQAGHLLSLILGGIIHVLGAGARFAWRGTRRIVRGVARRVGRAWHGMNTTLANVARRWRGTPRVEPPDPFDDQVAALVERFADVFPGREDPLSTDDLVSFRSIMPEWRKLCGHYDLVIGYATDGIFPLLVGKRPYVAYEHGTIRNIPFEPNLAGRLCAITYREADASLITNCDNILAAERLELDNHRFIPHPINEDWLSDPTWRSLRERLCQQLDSDFLIFHPSRQHWEPEIRHPSWEKGNDIFIRGFARFVREVNPRAGLVLVAWGKTLPESRALLAELGVADRVAWIDPVPTVLMTRYLRAAHVIADQFWLGAFGGVMPKAMIYGRPSLIYLDEQRHRWCFPEMPPICNTRDEADVFQALSRLYLDAEFRQTLIDDGLRWYARYHASSVVSRGFAEVLRDVCLKGSGTSQRGAVSERVAA